ncbi:acetate/propionate family kinase [Actinomadura livida]|uniref:Acetate kinase n=1 Tax=Actinomadura livida TaxID=79909 RepID=A0A7W7I9Q4_9ACTN|nr:MULTISPECIES: acetate/propionate family kinase [Actinomadura]MBB4773141.1 acetate kinase [Actinomadura catellatispora]GGU18280.1 acetate kinase [Actinomadura livida]
MRVLTVNPGSSSLKVSLLDDDDTVLAVESGVGHEMAPMVTDMPPPDAVGLRFVHGGTDFPGPVLIDAKVTGRLHELADLAPLHQPASLEALAEITAALPGVPAVACFDTSFHATLPDAAATYALPEEWRRRFGLRRYGFHGLSFAYAVRRTAEMLGTVPTRTVVCHLGAGASLCAVAEGRSVDTTMGFTPLEGLVMASRAGSVDPGIPLWLVRHGLSAEDVNTALERDSGLRGLTGIGDMRCIRALAAERDADALAALDVYHHRLRACAAAMTASLGGLDALVFTGGVGEHDPSVRMRLAEDLAYLGVSIDPDRNTAADDDTDITAPGASVRTLVIEAREDLEIATGTRRVLGNE